MIIAVVMGVSGSGKTTIGRALARELGADFLEGDKALIRQRMQARKNHFMPAGLLDSQFAALEEPGPDEAPIVIDVTPPLAILMGQLPRLLRASLSSASPPPY